MMMKHLQYGSFGADAASLIELRETPLPSPGPTQCLVEVLAAPINPADLLAMEGRYGAAGNLPARGGSEGVGQIIACGTAVDGLAAGTRVLLPFGSGTWSSHQLLPHDGLRPLPKKADVLQLAMLTCNPAAAALMLSEFASLTSGDWVIQNAANSGVGFNVIQLAKARGLRTINIVRRPELVPVLSAAGADQVVIDGGSMVDEIADIVADGRLLLGLDAVGGSATNRIAACLGAGGRLVSYGLLSGEPCQIDPFHLIFRQIDLCGFWRAKWFRDADPAWVSALMDGLIADLVAGRLHAPVQATFPLEQASEALRLAASPHRQGKVLFVPGAQPVNGV